MRPSVSIQLTSSSTSFFIAAATISLVTVLAMREPAEDRRSSAVAEVG
jgi:hypothetical protein